MTEVTSASSHEPSQVFADPNSAPVCSMVIPTYNGRELLDRCLSSIERNGPGQRGGTIEVVVRGAGEAAPSSEPSAPKPQAVVAQDVKPQAVEAP